MFASVLGGWELVLILALVLILVGAKRLPHIMEGLGASLSHFRDEMDTQAQEIGRAAGGIFGKPAAEALTAENQTAELYDPAAFGPHERKRSVRQLLFALCRKVLKWLRIKH
jgi:TatA/E family protein of Tat protein translocase